MPEGADPPLLSFAPAVRFSTACILSLGFVIASVVPTARFAQPVGWRSPSAKSHDRQLFRRIREVTAAGGRWSR